MKRSVLVSRVCFLPIKPQTSNLVHLDTPPWWTEWRGGGLTKKIEGNTRRCGQIPRLGETEDHHNKTRFKIALKTK